MSVVSFNDAMIPAFSTLLNELGFLRRLLFRIGTEARRFVYLSEEKMNEFSEKLKNETENHIKFEGFRGIYQQLCREKGYAFYDILVYRGDLVLNQTDGSLKQSSDSAYD